MKRKDETREKLISELAKLRRQIIKLEKSETENKRVAKELEESEENYRQLADSISDVFFEMDKDLRYTYWNKASEKLIGISAKDAIGKSLYEIFPDVKGTKVEKKYKEVLRTQKPTTFVNKYKLGDENYFFEISAYPSKRGLSVFVKDITKRKKAEEEIRKSREEYISVTNLTGDIIVKIDKEGRWTFLNDGACKFWGKSREKLMGVKFADYLHADDGKKTATAVQKMIKTKQIMRGVTNRQKTPNGWRTVEWNGTPIFDEAGKYAGMQATGRDITEIRQTEEALRESEQRFRSIFDNVVDGILIADTQNRKFYTGNKMICELLGYSLEEIKNLKVKDIHPKEDLPYILEHFKRQASGDYTLAKDIPVERKDGSVFYADINSSPVTLDGKTHLMGIFRDITERKKAEEILKESEERYRDLVEKADIAIMIDDREGNFKYFNKKFAELFGYSEKGMKRQSIQTLIHPEDARWVMEFHKARLHGGNTPSRYEFRGVKKDGSTIYLEVDVVELKEGKSIIGTRSYIWDITGRKMAEKALRESEERFRSVVVNSSDAIISVNAQGNIVFWNPAAKNVFGYSAEEAIGKPYEIILPKQFHTVFKKTFKQIVLWKRLGIIENRTEMIGLRKDGREFPMEVSLSSWITKEGIFFSSSIRDITEGKNATDELKNEYDALKSSAGVDTKGN